ncbi:MAG: SGNH/GDSL hydrolase family protein [Myxococcota bacterium]|jgi:hypothetical protein|nr:hypothetical protein [Deltaproteobacteria bacterium]MDP7075267.1 SGNH/GDSL hydrolase family protein [Myxococcota bacterium]MDP7434497.1 SGNH/GDSL hydrolase family protein [Myxococcota bacterium]
MSKQLVLEICASLLVSLLLVEGIVRIFGLAPEIAVISFGRYRLSANEKIGYEPRPRAEGADGASYVWSYPLSQVNEFGYRDRNHEREKPPGVFRIVVIGDSIAAGYRIDALEDVFPFQLEQALRRRGVDAEILNFGVSGYNTQQEVYTLIDRGLAYDPDLVVLAYCLNDRDRIDSGVLSILLASKGESAVVRSRIDRWLSFSAVYRMLRHRFARRELDEELARRDKAVEQDGVEDSLGRLANLSETRGFEVLVVVFPLLDNLARRKDARERQAIAELAWRKRLHHLDLHPALLDCVRREPQVGLDPYHPSVEGHRCAGDAIAQHLFARGFAPQRWQRGAPRR